MKVITMGNCCKKAKQNHENAIIACQHLGIDAPVNVNDVQEMMRYGVIFTPAIIVDDVLISSGRMLSVEQIEKILKDKLSIANK